jgi:hypothetical protein
MTDEAGTTSYQPIGGEGADLDGVEVLPALLYRYLQTDPDNLAVTLQVFAGVGAQLWEQEVRVLLRVASLQHPALPEMLNGGHIAADRISARLDGGHRHGSVAYVRTLADSLLGADDIDAVTDVMLADLVLAMTGLAEPTPNRGGPTLDFCGRAARGKRFKSLLGAHFASQADEL